MNKYLLILLVFYLSSVGLSEVMAASFDCNKAATSYEKTICSDSELNKLDSTLGKLYAEAKNKSIQGEYDKIKNAQKRWFKQRKSKCPNAQVNCLNKYYQLRNAELDEFLKSKPTAIEIQRKYYKLKYKEAPHYNTHIELTLPLFKGLAEDLPAKMYDALGIKSPEDTRAHVKQQMQYDTWLDKKYFYVNFNQYGVVQFTFWTDGVGAYPSSSVEFAAVDARRGKRISANDLFDKVSHKALFNIIEKQMQKAQSDSLAEYPDEEEIFTMFFQNAKLEEKHLDNFILSNEGITIFYDYGFPHAMEALTPESYYFISYKELEPFLKKNNPLLTFLQSVSMPDPISALYQ